MVIGVLVPVIVLVVLLILTIIVIVIVANIKVVVASYCYEAMIICLLMLAMFNSLKLLLLVQ